MHVVASQPICMCRGGICGANRVGKIKQPLESKMLLEQVLVVLLYFPEHASKTKKQLEDSSSQVSFLYDDNAV